MCFLRQGLTMHPRRARTHDCHASAYWMLEYRHVHSFWLLTIILYVLFLFFVATFLREQSRFFAIAVSPLLIHLHYSNLALISSTISTPTLTCSLKSPWPSPRVPHSVLSLPSVGDSGYYQECYQAKRANWRYLEECITHKDSYWVLEGFLVWWWLLALLTQWSESLFTLFSFFY